MDKLKTIYIKPWHFILLFIILLILTNIVDVNKTGGYANEMQGEFIELDSYSFDTVISSQEYSFVLFYDEDCELCRDMEYNLSQLMHKEKNKYYKLDIKKNNKSLDLHYISGTPTISIYKGGKETKRIMGIVSASNLEMIFDRIKNENTYKYPI